MIEPKMSDQSPIILEKESGDEIVVVIERR